MKCSKDCFNCQLLRCIHDIEDRQEYIRDVQRKKERERHAEYYRTHKAEIDAKQKEYDKLHRNAEKCHEFYLRNKSRINQKNKERYQRNREDRLIQAKAYYYEHKAEISERRKKRYQEKKLQEQLGGE